MASGRAPGQPSNQLYAGWAALGLASAGYDLNHVARGGASVVDYVRASAGSSDVGSLERTILVVRAAGLSARDFGGHDLIGALEHRVRADGSVSGQVNLTAFAVLALRADGVVPAGRTLGWLERQQDGDGGFGFSGAGGSSDADDTGAALEALPGRAPGRWPGSRRERSSAASRTTTAGSLPARGGIQRPVDRLGDPGARSPRASVRARCTAGCGVAAGPSCGR